MRRLPTAVVATLLIMACAASASAQRASFAASLRDTTLANGLKVYVFEDHAVPLATAEIVVHGGAMAQDSGLEGVPHLYEHMLFKGYGSGQEAFQHDLFYLHGTYNGSTGYEHVAYYVIVSSKKIGEGLSILSRMLRDPDFDNDGLTRERAVVFNEFDRDMADPVFQLRRNVERRLWSTAWGRKNPLGEPAAISAATPATLKAIYHRYYVPNNAAVFVSGDVSTAEVFNEARHAFDGWRAAPDPFVASPVPPIPALPGTQAVVMTGDVQDATVMIAWQGPSVGETPDQTYAADVFSTMVNDPASRVQQRLVKSGLFQELGISYLTEHHVGPIALVGRTTLDSLPHALAALRHELIDWGMPDAFDADALEGARQERRVAQALELQNGTTAALRFGEWWGIAGLDYYKSYPDRLLAVSALDVNQYVTTYIDAPYVIGVLGPKGTNDALTADVRGFIIESEPSAAK
jgi:zinc protease